MARIVPEHVHPAGTSPAVGVAFTAGRFVADQVAPVVAVAKLEDNIPVFGRAAWARDEARPVSAHGSCPLLSPTVTITTRYRCVKSGARMAVPLEVAENCDWAMERVGGSFVREKTNLRRERKCSALLFTAGNWTNGTTLAADDQWSNTTASTPLVNIATGIETVEDEIGRRPNTVVLGRDPSRDFCAHPTVSDLITSNLAVPVEELLARYFRLDQFVMAESTHCTSNEGATDAFAAIWGKSAWIGYVNLEDASPEALRPSATYTLRMGDGKLTERVYVDKGRETALAECYEMADELVTCDLAGYLIQAATA